jgi:membrane associated rhomboid family serine protease/Flp pilus assembly protein TadD
MAEPVTLRTDAGDEQLELDEFEARVRRGEISPQSMVCLPAVTQARFVPACELELYQRLHEPRRAYFSRAFSVSRFPWLTSALILLNLGVFLFTVRQSPMELDDMVRFGGKVGPLVRDLGEFWRLFTANFLHRDAVHLGLNMFVLFNVGGALENTYRTLDYLWLLVFTGIATMGTSLLLNDAVTIGASGMVYGCLGGVLAFGLRYRGLLPARYRSIMADAALPTVLGLLLIGVTSTGVDNWAHVGGLAAGLLTGTFMRPRLLADTHAAKWEPAVRALPSLAVLTLVFFGQALFADALPQVHYERDDVFGIATPVPRGWGRGADPLGSVAWYNGLASLGRASFAVEAIAMPEGADATLAARRFLDEWLEPGRLGPEAVRVKHEPLATARLGDRDVLRLRGALEGERGTTRFLATFVPRGDLVYQLVFTWPQAFPRYGHVAEQLLLGVKFEEPRELRQARAQALLFPNSPQALARLGRSLLAQGNPEAAAQALTSAVRAAPEDVSARCALSRAWLSAGEVERACQASAAALNYAPTSAETLEADARCQLARGELELALERLKAARVAAPNDERLRSAQQKLEATLQ